MRVLKKFVVVLRWSIPYQAPKRYHFGDQQERVDSLYSYHLLSLEKPSSLVETAGHW